MTMSKFMTMIVLTTDPNFFLNFAMIVLTTELQSVLSEFMTMNLCGVPMRVEIDGNIRRHKGFR
jgi:hypothetical protein